MKIKFYNLWKEQEDMKQFILFAICYSKLEFGIYFFNFNWYIDFTNPNNWDR